jgi:hypothetical protein
LLRVAIEVFAEVTDAVSDWTEFYVAESPVVELRTSSERVVKLFEVVVIEALMVSSAAFTSVERARRSILAWRAAVAA